MRHGIAIVSAACLCVGAALSGCGESVDLPDTAPLTGKVTLDGKPLAGASISFRPVETGEGSHAARATSDDGGNFTAMTYFSAAHDLEGAVSGKYQVSVTKLEEAAATSSSATPPASHEQTLSRAPAGRPGRGGDHGYDTPKNILPEAYGKPESSGLEVEVKAGEDNTVNLELTSK